MRDDDTVFLDAVRGLEHGDFSRLEPLFVSGGSDRVAQPSHIMRWHEEGRFRDEPKAAAEALTCACFLGRTDVAEFLLARGAGPSGGASTGLDALHWSANRGQLEAVRLLLRWRAPLETRSMHGGTALGTAIWSAINEPRPDHLQIIEELLEAGARVDNVGYPTGNGKIDALLRRHGASAAVTVEDPKFREIFTKTGHQTLNAFLIVSGGFAASFLAFLGATFREPAILGSIGPEVTAAFVNAMWYFVLAVLLSLAAHGTTFLSHAAYYRLWTRLGGVLMGLTAGLMAFVIWAMVQGSLAAFRGFSMGLDRLRPAPP